MPCAEPGSRGGTAAVQVRAVRALSGRGTGPRHARRMRRPLGGAGAHWRSGAAVGWAISTAHVLAPAAAVKGLLRQGPSCARPRRARAARSRCGSAGASGARGAEQPPPPPAWPSRAAAPDGECAPPCPARPRRGSRWGGRLGRHRPGSAAGAAGARAGRGAALAAGSGPIPIPESARPGSGGGGSGKDRARGVARRVNGAG